MPAQTATASADGAKQRGAASHCRNAPRPRRGVPAAVLQRLYRLSKLGRSCGQLAHSCPRPSAALGPRCAGRCAEDTRTAFIAWARGVCNDTLGPACACRCAVPDGMYSVSTHSELRQLEPPQPQAQPQQRHGRTAVEAAVGVGVLGAAVHTHQHNGTWFAVQGLARGAAPGVSRGGGCVEFVEFVARAVWTQAASHLATTAMTRSHVFLAQVATCLVTRGARYDWEQEQEHRHTRRGVHSTTGNTAWRQNRGHLSKSGKLI